MAADDKGMKKPVGLLAILGGKPKAPASEPPPAGDSPRKLAAQGVMDAIKDWDVDALADALDTFLDAGRSDTMRPPA
jgi:hypothetical protein